MDEKEFEPHQRRAEDSGFANVELVLYQIAELKAALKEGFARMEGRFETLEKRLISLERYRERAEERDRAANDAARNVNQRWIPVALGLVGLVVTIWLAYQAGG